MTIPVWTEQEWRKCEEWYFSGITISLCLPFLSRSVSPSHVLTVSSPHTHTCSLSLSLSLCVLLSPSYCHCPSSSLHSSSPRVINVLKRWVGQHFYDFDGKPILARLSVRSLSLSLCSFTPPLSLSLLRNLGLTRSIVPLLSLSLSLSLFPASSPSSENLSCL